MHLSPWHVKSLQDFTFICCPECDYKSNDPIPFESHALENHPSSIDFFQIDKVIVVLDSNVIPKYALEYQDNVSNGHASGESTYPNVKIKEEKDQDPLFVDDIIPCDQENVKQDPFNNEFLPKIEKSLKTNDDSFMDEATFSDVDQTNPESSDKDDTIVREESRPNHEGLEKIETSPTKKKKKLILTTKDTPTALLQHCLVCLKDFGTMAKRNKHIIDEHPKITCGKCDLVLEDYKLLAKHYRAKHRRSKCEECEEEFCNPWLMRMHHRNVHILQKKEYKCKKCPYETDIKLNLKSHHYENHRYDRKVWEGVAKDKNEIIKCELCQINVKAKGYLIHFKKAHGGKLPSHFMPGEKHVCEFCSVEFQYLSYLQTHIEKHHSTNSQPNEMKKCHLCKQEFGINGYIQHYRSRHNCFPPEYEDKPKYCCDQCGKVFLAKPVLDLHLKKSHSGRKWTCEFCSEDYDAYLDLRNHISQNHSSEREVRSVKNPQTCKLCNVDFKSFNGFLSHYRTFHNSFPPGYEDKPKFPCAECDKIYISREALRAHRKTHKEGFKKYKPKKVIRTCEYCSKTFMDTNNFIEHVKIKHENVHNYECEVCSKKFFVPSLYKHHVTLQHKKDPCPICKGGPFNKRDMKRHNLKAHGIKPATPFGCDKCDRFFQSEKTLNLHKTRVHNK